MSDRRSMMALGAGLAFSLGLHLLALPAALAGGAWAWWAPGDAEHARAGGSRQGAEAAHLPELAGRSVERVRSRPVWDPLPSAKLPEMTNRAQPPSWEVRTDNVRLGKAGGTAKTRVSWISYEDFQDLIAPHGSTDQPAVQSSLDPVAGAPVVTLPNVSAGIPLARGTIGNPGSSGTPGARGTGEQPPHLAQAVPRVGTGGVEGLPGRMRAIGNPSPGAVEPPRPEPAPGPTPAPAPKPPPTPPPPPTPAPAPAPPAPPAPPERPNPPTPKPPDIPAPPPPVNPPTEPPSLPPPQEPQPPAPREPAPPPPEPAPPPAPPTEPPATPGPPPESPPRQEPQPRPPSSPTRPNPAERPQMPQPPTTQPMRVVDRGGLGEVALAAVPVSRTRESEDGVAKRRRAKVGTTTQPRGERNPGKPGTPGNPGSPGSSEGSGIAGNAAGPGTPGLSRVPLNVHVGQLTAAPRSDYEMEPTSLTGLSDPVNVRPGRVLTGDGIEIKTALPEIGVVTAISAIPKNPVARVVFDPQGQVVDVTLMKSTGYADWDGPITASFYRWRATGERLTEQGEGFFLDVILVLTDAKDDAKD